MRFLSLALLLAAATASAQTQQTLYPGLQGQPLLDALRADYAPTSSLGYNGARDALYAYEQATHGQLCGVYSGFCVTLTPGADPSSDAFSKGINAEHTWPQSMGARGSGQAKGDMHNLFPSKIEVNSARGSYPFGEIADADTYRWYRGTAVQSTTPGTAIDEWSELVQSNPAPGFSGAFEPREDHAGNAARAVFYFAAIYPDLVAAYDAEAFFDAQKDDLIIWHYQDPADVREQDRSAWIATQQGNHNPFVLDSTLARRAFDLSGGGEPPPPPPPPPPGTPATAWINELHYDNGGTDVGEGVEIAGLAGGDLGGFSLVLYNGSSGASYATIALSGVLPDQQGGHGTLWFSAPGLQNGSPDGLALVDDAGGVVQFLSYEGSFTASDGPAAGLASTDIGVSESSGTAAGESLQLRGTGDAYADFAWQDAQTDTPGQPNAGQTFEAPEPPPPPAATPWVNELHYDNAGDDKNEGIEIAGEAGIDLAGWTLALYDGATGSVYGTVALAGVIDDEGSGYGALWTDIRGLQENLDGFALVSPEGTVVQFLSYEGSFTASSGPASGQTSIDIGVREPPGAAQSKTLQIIGTGTAYEDFRWRTQRRHSRGVLNNKQTVGGSAKLAVRDEEQAQPMASRVAVVPNPATSRATVTVAVEEGGAARVDVLDALGRSVAVLYRGTLSQGTHSFPVSVSAWAPGIYTLRVIGASGVEARRLTVTR